MYCCKCGRKIQNDAKFCPVCGNKLALQEELTIVLDGKTMTAMDLTQYCLERRYFGFEGLKWESMKKNVFNQFRIFFGNIIQDMQNDETPLLCFMGEYNKESILENGGLRAFLLTDKRLISSSWFDKILSWKSLFDWSVSWKSRSEKTPRCALFSIYIRDLMSVEPTMIRGCDAITFHKVDGDFYVRFFCYNTTHALCDQINGILRQLREKGTPESRKG